MGKYQGWRVEYLTTVHMTPLTGLMWNLWNGKVAWYEYVPIRLHEVMTLFKTILLTQYVLRQLICTWVQICDSRSIMTNDYELIANYGMVVSLGKWLFEVNRCDVLIFGIGDWNLWIVAGKHA